MLTLLDEISHPHTLMGEHNWCCQPLQSRPGVNCKYSELCRERLAPRCVSNFDGFRNCLSVRNLIPGTLLWFIVKNKLLFEHAYFYIHEHSQVVMPKKNMITIAWHEKLNCPWIYKLDECPISNILPSVGCWTGVQSRYVFQQYFSNCVLPFSILLPNVFLFSFWPSVLLSALVLLHIGLETHSECMCIVSTDLSRSHPEKQTLEGA